MQVDFYHLTRRPLEQVLPRIAEKVLADGERLLIVAEAAEQRARIDQLLWGHAPEAFLPHGVAEGESDALQPVLIAGAPDPGNGARFVAIVDGRWRDEALGFERAFHFFDEDRIAEARAAWKSLADRPGVERRYWKQTERGWEQAA